MSSDDADNASNYSAYYLGGVANLVLLCEYRPISYILNLTIFTKIPKGISRNIIVYIKDFDQLSFEYQSLKDFLINSNKYEIKRIEIESISGCSGDSLYICEKQSVSGRLEAFVALFSRYIHNAEEWMFSVEDEHITDILSFQIIPALRSFNFDFQSYDYTIGRIANAISGLKKSLDHGRYTVEVFTNQGISRDPLFCQLLLEKIERPISFALLGPCIRNSLQLFETLDHFVLKNTWSKN
jgi:hypothetical protein